MGYKFFNTVIDDVFSFVVDMPLSHRIACFRDDAVFLVFLWQLWAYRVDKTRANEFGMAYEEEEDNGEVDGDGVGNAVAAITQSTSSCSEEGPRVHSAPTNEQGGKEETFRAAGELPIDEHSLSSSSDMPEPIQEPKDGTSIARSSAQSGDGTELPAPAKESATQQLEDELNDFAAWM